MKIRATISKFLIISAFATTTVFGQTTYTWTNAAGGLITGAANWNPNTPAVGGLTGPNGNDGSGIQQTAQWDGATTSNLIITNTGASLPNTGFNTIGINLLLTTNQTNSVQFISTVAISAQIGLNAITNNSPNASIILGDFNTPANLMRLTGRPAAATHFYVNNSTAPAIINPSAEWQAGGGNAYTIDFGGTGNWSVLSSLRNDNGSGGTSIILDGPGIMTWTNGTRHTATDPLNTVTVNGGQLILTSSGLLPSQAGNSTITLNAPLVFNAPSQSDTITRVIAGTGPLIVTNGTLTLSGPGTNSTYTGNTLLGGGELIVNGPENVGVSGPLGVGGTISFTGGTLGFTANNTFDYSSRFSTSAGQAFSFDTGGQNLFFATSLSNASGTLAKNGSGTLTLSGTSAYSGATTVNAGKLVFQGSKTGAGSITVTDSSAVGVTATGTPVTPGTLTLGTSAGATLEFNNVNSTVTAPLVAVTLASAGTLTININSGTFTVGQTYPLLTWTIGSAPVVSLGTLNGFIGNLSFTGNTLNLKITGTAFSWTGLSNGNWDTATANNWFQNGAAAVFANGGPVLFDDTAKGTTAVTLNGVVLPASVTINNNTNIYSLTSSSGKDIGGTGGLTKSGTNTLTISGGANAYTGVTTVSGGLLSVSALANGGSPSDIGAATNSAASLVLNGGTLQYTGAGANIDHLFTLGTSGGAIDSSGAGALNLTNTGAIAYSGTGARFLLLTGTDAGTNMLAAVLADNGGATSLILSGSTAWNLTANNTYSGVTTITSGTLQLGAGGATGSTGSGNIVDDGALNFNRTNTLTVSGTVTGPGFVTQNGSGTVILPGNNTYSGGTTINAGTLQIGNGGGTGTLSANNGVVDNGILTFNSTTSFTLNGVISGTGQLIKQGSGLLKLLGNNTFTGPTTVSAGGALQICSGNQGSFASPYITNNGTLLFVRQDNAAFIYSGVISGTGSVTKEANNDNFGDVTLTGTNTYTGGTLIRAGSIILGDNVNAGFGTITGNVIFTNSGVTTLVGRTLAFNRPDNFTFSGNIVGGVTNVGNGAGQIAVANAGAVTLTGSGTVTLTGNNTYPAVTTITAGTLQIGAGGASGNLGPNNVTDNGALVFDRSDNVTYGGIISGGGSVVQLGSGILTLPNVNTYTGATIVSNGTLVLTTNLSGPSTNVIGGDLDLNGGDVVVGSAGSISMLQVPGNLNISSGAVTVNLNKSLAPSNTFYFVNISINSTGGSLKLLNYGPALAVGDKFTIFSQPISGGAAMTIESPGFTVTNRLAVDGSVTVTGITLPGKAQITATSSGGQLKVSWPASDTGLRLQAQTNSLFVGISNNWVDVPGTELTNAYSIPIGTNGAVFYRLAPQ